jgi:hypothetical protein
MMEQENILLKGFVEADETYMGKKREAIRTSGLVINIRCLV